MNRTIRQITAGEIPQAMDLVWRVFAVFEAPEYSAEGVVEFRQFIQKDAVLTKMQSGRMILWGCFVHSNIVGVLAVAVTGHIHLLFVDSAYHRQGIAKALYQTMLDYFRMHGISSITVNSSPYAVEVYRRLGFVSTNTEQTVNGIRFTPMQLQLAQIPIDA